MNEGLKFVQNSDIEYKEATDKELCIKECPWCNDDRYKLYVNKEKGLYDCKKCGEHGNIYELKAKYGVSDEINSAKLEKDYFPLDEEAHYKYERLLWESEEGLGYVRSRGFTDETIKHFRLGLAADWLLIPHYSEKQLWNYKKRNIREKLFKRVLGQPTILFNADNVDFKKESLVVVESETDAMAAWQMGITNVVAVTGGAQTFEPRWMRVFNRFKKVFVVLNSDSAGQKGALKLANKIGINKCLNVILPVKDVNDYLKDSTLPNIREFIKENGFHFDAEDVTSIRNYIKNIDDWFDGDGSMSGLTLPEFPQLNAVINGFKAEDLIILIADSGVGKTTWTLNAMRQMLRDGHKCLAFCLEGKVNYYILRMMCALKEKKLEELRADTTEWELLKDEFAEMPLYFYSGSQAAMTPSKMQEMLPSVVKMYDIEFVMIDNLQKFVRGVDNVPALTSHAVSGLKDLAVDLKIPILLISHITKKPMGNSSPLTMHDAKSSSTIYQDADMMLIIDVKQDKSYELVVEKNRMGEGGVRIPVFLNKETARYYETSRELMKTEMHSSESIDDNWKQQK